MLPQELLGVRRRRKRTAGEATGRALELGVGTGLNLNLGFYANADEVVGVDPDPHVSAVGELDLGDAC